MGMILGAQELATASNDKEGVTALMNKIQFEAEKYRCGHTMVFFRAGALAALEEARDTIVLKLVRFLQGEAYKRLRGKVFQKKHDQRELMKVIQRNFRKYFSLRTWGWFIIIQKTKPLVGQLNPEQELANLEEKVNEVYGAYQDALNVTKSLEAENGTVKEEITALTKQLESEQGNLTIYQERQAKAAAQKVNCEQELAKANTVLKNEIEDLELALQRLEQDKTNRDHTIRGLNDEIAQNDEAINKLNKEKKHIGDNQAKSSDDLQSAEEKVNHLNGVKSKLESTLDELENGANTEKRARAGIEKERRKVEGELKMAQEMVTDLENAKRDLESSIARKEKDIMGLNSKLDDEQSVVAKMQKSIKETQARVEEYEEELEAERQARAKAERQRSDLARELDQLGERLNEAGGATAAQLELNKKREAEVGKLRKDIEEK